MLIRHTKLLRDWHTRERQAQYDPRIERDSFIVKMAHGFLALGLVGLFAWLLWQITGPQAMVFFYRLAGG